MNTPAPASLVLECDELCTFVTRHTHQLWIWLALDRQTRKIVSCSMGQRDAVSAFGLWDGLPTPYLDAVCHTDRLSAYKSVVFGALHRIGGTQQHPVEREDHTAANNHEDQDPPRPLHGGKHAGVLGE